MEDELAGVTDIRDRRRIQNRLSQRKRRDKLRDRSTKSESPPLLKNLENETKSLSSLVTILRAALDMQMQFQAHGSQERPPGKNDGSSSLESLLTGIESLNASSPHSVISMKRDNSSVMSPPGESTTNIPRHMGSENSNCVETAMDLEILGMPVDAFQLSTTEPSFDTGLQNSLETTWHHIQHKLTDLGDCESLQPQNDIVRDNEKGPEPIYFVSSSSLEDCPSSKSSRSSSNSSCSSNSGIGSGHAQAKRRSNSDQRSARLTPSGLLLVKVDETIAQLVSLYKFATELELMQEKPGLLDLLDMVQAKFHSVPFPDSSVPSPSQWFEPTAT